MIRATSLSVAASALVHVTIVADGVTALVETCGRCSSDTIAVRGPGHHDESIVCFTCGAVMAAPSRTPLPSSDSTSPKGPTK